MSAPLLPITSDLSPALAAVAQSTSAPVIVTDAEDRIQWANSAFAEVTGWSLEEARGRTPRALLDPASANAWPRARALDAPAASDATALQLRRRCGDPYWAQVDICALRDATGRLTHHLHLHTDVTARVQAEQRAAETQRWLQLAGSVFGQGLWQMGVADGLMVWDEPLKRMLGLAPETPTPSFAEFIARHVAPADRRRLARTARQVPAAGEHTEIEFHVLHADGTQRTLVSRQACVEVDADGRPRRLLGAVLDVTEARRTTLRLRDALRRLRLAAEASGVGAWERDLETGEGHWDPTMFTLMGLLPAERAPSREATLQMVHPDDRASVSIAWQRMATERRPVEYEYRIVRPDRSVVNIITRAVVEHDADGRPRLALGTAIDITAVRQTERERDALTRRIELVADAVGLGIWEWEPATGLSLWNDRMYGLYGHTRDSFRDLMWYEAVHPEDRARARAVLDRAARDGAPFDVEFRVLHPGGEVRWLASRGRGEVDAQGRVLRVYGVNWDITERVNIEQTARAAERTARDLLERMQLATSATGMGIWELDVGRNDLVWDRPQFRLFGREPADGTPWQVFRAAVHPDDLKPVLQQLDAAIASGRRLEVEFRVVLPDGAIRWLAGRGLLREGSQGRVMLGVNWDVTERRVAESALRAKETAERASAAKTEFLSRMSHELRTPLNAILGFTQLLELDARQPLTPQQQERVGHIRQAGWHLLTLINEVLDLSRIEAGAARIEIGPVALAPILDECRTLIATDAERRRLQVDLQFGPGTPAQVLADRTRLKQILLNLLSNAVKYNREGGRVAIAAAAHDDGRCTISVRDTGIGISPAQMDKLFQPFNRLGLESAKIEGTGIGLTIALKLAEQMGGRLEASSEPGVGSEFRLTLRAAAADHASAAAAPEAPRSSELAGSVLCLVDDPADLDRLRGWLRQRPGVTLFPARDEAAARLLAPVCQPDLILLDLQPAPTQKLALLQRLRALPALADVPCVGLLDNAAAGDLAPVHAAGVSACVARPLDGGSVLRCLDAALGRTAQSR
jgi:PAS domain S-box-containing protein